MRTNTIIITLIILLTSSVTLSAERLKYDAVYKSVLSGNKDEAYTLLLAYQRQDPGFANTYFQLGIIAKEWAKSYNPYKEFIYTKLFIYNAKLYFNLAKLYMKNEKGKNRSYYKNAPIIPKGKKLQIEDINSYIDSQIEDIEDYEKNVVKIVNFYNKSSDSYNSCVSLFMKINSDYAKIKNIYLSEDPKLFSEMQKLESDFDSTLIYFQLYKEALNKFPIQNYNQSYKLKNIITYRLDGLTYSDFLQNNILLWDYKNWVHDVKQVKESIIKNSRAEILNLDSEIKSKINTVLNGEYSDHYPKYKTDEKFIYKIEKFDNNSLLLKLFKLNETKLNFLNFFKKEINDPVFVTKFPISKRAEYCNNFFSEKAYADSINKIFLSAVKPEQIKKHINFYVSNYGGLNGLKEYSFRQDLFFDAKLKDALLNLKKQMYYSTYQIDTDSLIYNKKLISKKIVNPVENIPGPDVYRITGFNETKDNQLWINGYYVSDDNEKNGFVGYSEDKKHIKFIKTSGKNKSYNLVSSAFNDGCWVITTTLGDEIKNTLIRYNNSGKQEFSQELSYHIVPRLMKYDDINNTLLIVFNGKSLNPISDDSEQIIFHYNPNDQLQTYEVKMQAKATVFDMIRVNNKTLLFSNFVNYNDLNGNIVYSKAGSQNNKTNILVTILSKGMVKKQIPFFNPNPFFGVKALKINSNTLNILGYKSELITTNYNTLSIKELYYELIDAQGEKIYSAWHD